VGRADRPRSTELVNLSLAVMDTLCITYLLLCAVNMNYGRPVKRCRLEPQQRREQLLDVGAAMFAEKPYEDVFVEDIAARAQVSRALLYHYYPSKRDLYIAIFKRASNRLLARTHPDPQLPLAEQLANGLEAHIQYFADHPFEAITLNRGALSDDPTIQAIVTEELNVVGQRLIHKLVTEGRPRDVTEIAVEGWLAFVRAACVKWVQSQKISRADLTETCLRAFECASGYPNKSLASSDVGNMRSTLTALLPRRWSKT
jgi:AcrR family transcriptional regulator